MNLEPYFHLRTDFEFHQSLTAGIQVAVGTALVADWENLQPVWQFQMVVETLDFAPAVAGCYCIPSELLGIVVEEHEPAVKAVVEMEDIVEHTPDVLGMCLGG